MSSVVRVACVLCLAGGAALASPAAALDEERVLLPDDGSGLDGFGRAVAVSGSIAVVGTDSGGADDGGAAYVFDAASGEQRYKLEADDHRAGTAFGQSVAVSEGVIVIGASAESQNGRRAGAVYLFDASTGAQRLKLLAEDGSAEDRLGTSVATDGAVVVAGAPEDFVESRRSGTAYVFDAASGAQLRKLAPFDGQRGDEFGASIAVGGGVVLVGAPFDDTEDGDGAGSAYAFDLATGQLLFKLTADDGDSSDRFGSSVALSGRIAIIGAPLDEDNGQFSGSAYLFDLHTGGQIAKLIPSRSGSQDAFGESVGIDGGIAVVGAYLDDAAGESSGAAYTFNVFTGEEADKLVATDGGAWDNLGVSVAISGTTVLAGSPGDDEQGFQSGSAYVFEVSLAGLPCPPDWDGNEVVNASDVGVFLSDYFLDLLNGTDRADFNRDGQTDTRDVSDFLNAYFPLVGACP